MNGEETSVSNATGNRKSRVKKGQLRQWSGEGGFLFLVVRSRIKPVPGWRRRATPATRLASVPKGERVWDLLQEGKMFCNVGNYDIFMHSEVISETG
jgi:hypothetical protein